MSSRRPAAVLTLALALGCSPAATALSGDGPAGDIRAIHITRDGVEVPPVLRVGALGPILLDIVLEDATGSRIPRVDEQATWGSTNPGVADAGMQFARGEIYVNRNGEARIVAYFGGMRDTVTFQVAQVAVAGRVDADTIVTLTPDARNLNGAANGYHEFRYGAARLDSNGFAVSSTVPMQFDPGPDPIFNVQLEPRGDTIAVRGLRMGTSELHTTFGDFTDIVPVQVTDAYRVVRLIETAGGAMRTVPDTVRIPAGAAVIFQNETRNTLLLGAAAEHDGQWRAGPMRPNGRQAQLFTIPGRYLYNWLGGTGAVIVTP
jgi:hypothetical protein